MNISKYEQRVLHALAQGGAIYHERTENGKIRKIICFTREGHILSDCTFEIFKRLRKRRFILSKNGQPYRASRLGVTSVRSQLDNR
ncbi:YjhX family toxin [Sneathiella sp.]|uniref:YjhX family toxin n=1 Tax=Sneathiella sp. TaxID=1964365 RepID=UPI003FA75D35